MKLFKHIMAIAAIALTAFTGCRTADIEEITDLNLGRCLEPMNLSGKVIQSKGDEVTFSWDVTKDAEKYNLAVYYDEAMANEAFTKVLEASEVPYTVKLTADTTYFFKVQATSSERKESKWAYYDKKISTFAVKSPLYLETADRQTSSVSVKWSTEVSDYLDVTHITCGLPGKEEGLIRIELTDEQKQKGAAVIEGLAPSTEYVVTLYYASASRGQVDVWTMPDTSQTVEVYTSAALEQGIKDGAVMLLKLEGSPYTIGSGLDAGLATSKGFTLYGEGSADGTRPQIIGTVMLNYDFNAEAILFEGVDFNGNAGSCGHPIAIVNGSQSNTEVKVASIVYRNCALHGYSKGLIYEWNNYFTMDRLEWNGCEIYAINEDGGGGGDVIDFRSTTTVNELNLEGNTIYNGMRTFVRIDKGTWPSINICHNTLRNLCLSDNTNNAGIIAINKENGTSVGTISVTGNLFLSMPEKATLGSGNAKYYSADDLGCTFTNNWFYDCADTFFTDNWPEAKATSGGGKLSADPCWNAKGGYFNITTDSEINGKEVGAPKWWVPYVEKPEDLTLDPLDGPHVWNFGDAKYFSGVIKKQMVRDGIFVSGSETCPISFEDGTASFSTATVCSAKGVPQDGYLSFKVLGPGSVTIRPETAEAQCTAHIIVASAPTAGGALTVKGGASPQLHAESAQKILVKDVAEETMVYVYASDGGSVAVKDLAWSEDTTQVNTALPAPAPAAAPASFIKGTAQDVTVTWEPVENAASYSVKFSGKTYSTEECSYTIEGRTTSMLDEGSYQVEVYANPGEKDIYNTQSDAGKAAFAVMSAGGGGGGEEFIVSSVEDLLTAIAAGKDAITLKYSTAPYEIGALTLTAPIHLKGQVSGSSLTPVKASFTISGEIGGSIVLKNLDITNDAVSVLIEDKTTAAPIADTVALYNCNVTGTKALYDNSGKAASEIQNLIFDGIYVKDSSDGADFIDMRNGKTHNLKIVNSTFANSARTFIRTDAGHEMNTVLVRNNTFYKVCTNSTSKDNNGLFHIRSAAGSGMQSYKIQNNFFYSILIDEEPGNAAGYPKFISKNAAALKPNAIMNNYFYNIEEREERSAYSWWTVNCSREEGTAGGGAVVPADPCKDAANGDYTLTNGVMMNAGVGDPRWNPMAGSTPSSEITVKTTDDLLTAISAGKKTITLAAGTYDFTTATATEIAAGKYTLTTPLNLIGESGAKLIGGFIFKEGVTSFSAEGLELDGASTVDNAFDVADANVVMTKFTLRNCNVTAYKNRLFYMGQTASVTSAEFSGNFVTGVSGADFTSGDFIDVRKGTLQALKVQNNTFANCIRTFARVDAAVVMSSAQIVNNTFYNLCYVDSKDNNGILHFRSSTLLADSTKFTVRSNIFASMHRAAETPSQTNGFPKLVSTASEKLGHPMMLHNYFYDVQTDEGYSWWNTYKQELALAGYGILLTENPFKDAANLDFTLTNALAASENVGDPRWNNTRPGKPEEGYNVASLEDLLTAVAAGKSVINLAYGTYDLTAVTGNEDVAAGVWTLRSGLTLRGVSKSGLKPEFIGGFKPAMTDGGFSLEGLKLNGKNADASVTIGNMVDVDAAAVVGKLTIKDCEIYGFNNRLVSASGESVIGPADLSGLLVHDFGTSGDFFDVRKGSIESISISNSTFWNGIRTFLRVDAAVACGAVSVTNNTFFNLCAVDSKDNNGIMHVRSGSATANPRQITVTKNIFASMKRASETPGQANGFPKLVSTASEKIAHPSIADNLFWDIQTESPYSWWNTMTEESVKAAGQVLEASPFTGDTSVGKFTVSGAWKGYGDLRW